MPNKKSEFHIRRLPKSTSFLKPKNNHKSTSHQLNETHTPSSCFGSIPLHSHYCQVNCVNSSNQSTLPHSRFSHQFNNSFSPETWPHSLPMESTGCNTADGTGRLGFGSSAGGPSGGNREPNKKRTGSYQQKKHRRAYVVDEFARWIFPLSFVGLNIGYWTYYLNLIDSLPEFGSH